MTRTLLKKSFIQTVREQIDGAFVLAVFFLIAIVYVNLTFLSKQERHANWVAHTYEAMLKIETVAFDIQRCESSVRGYAATRQNDYLDAYRDSLNNLSESQKALSLHVKDNNNQIENLSVLQRRINTRLSILEEAIGMTRSGLTAEQLAASIKRRGLEAMLLVTETVEIMEKEERRLLVVRTQERETSRSQLNVTLIASQAFVILIMFTFFVIAKLNLGVSYGREATQ